jgi:uncharacterized protein (DUF1330 family)
MACFLIARYTVRDADATSRYSALAAPTMVKHGGQIVYRGKCRDLLAGHDRFEHAVVAAFPGREQALAWYRSPDYQSLIPLRDEGVDIEISLYE